ncbi:MAG TPA: D-alanyl-D-alanine carboxypeptidase [Candidatus Scybalocola faecipullorum]|mgnify:FL=1|nr:D-alanyl-D-alanine carboxypeptidase [Candidatus Scybalocola faecipullorum]
MRKYWVRGIAAVCCIVMLLGNMAFAEDEAASKTADLTLQTPSAVLMEASTGEVIFEKGADDKRALASVTKVMTLLLIFDALEDGRIQLTDEVTTSAHAKSMGGSQVFLEEGEKQSVETLIKCIVIASGNDAAVAMAEYIGGSEEAFVEMMNGRAKALGMANTHFVDCCGLTDSSDHYSTARDIALMTRELITKYPQIYDYAQIWMEDITHVTAKGSTTFTLSNTNKLLRQFDGCTGLKTGSTSTAKYCLSATASRNGIDMIAVLLASPDSKTRFAEAAAMLNYGFARCSLYRDDNPPVPENIIVNKGKSEQARLAVSGSFSYVSMGGEDLSQIERIVKVDEQINAPAEKGTKVGEITYNIGGKTIGSVEVVLDETVERAGFLDHLKKAGEAWGQCL